MRKKKEKLLSATQLSKRLGVRLAQIYLWDERGWIPLDKHKIGGRIKWVWDRKKLFKTQAQASRHAEILEIVENDLKNLIYIVRRIRKEQHERLITTMLPLLKVDHDAKK